MGAVAEIPIAFRDRMSRLVGLKFAPANLSTHWEALRDLSADELDAAIDRAQRECEEFPSPKMLRVFIDDYRRARAVPDEDLSREAELISPFVVTLPDGTEVAVRRRWTYYCDDCSDTGYVSYWCGNSKSARFPWLAVVRCESKKCERLRVGGYEHEYVRPCPCAEMNPDVQRRKVRAQQVVRKGDKQ